MVMIRRRFFGALKGWEGQAKQLVSRFQSSQELAADAFANFGIEATLEILESSVAYGLKFLIVPAAEFLGTSNPPH